MSHCCRHSSVQSPKYYYYYYYTVTNVTVLHFRHYFCEWPYKCGLNPTLLCFSKAWFLVRKTPFKADIADITDITFSAAEIPSHYSETHSLLWFHATSNIKYIFELLWFCVWGIFNIYHAFILIYFHKIFDE